jgi:hypothetical protein
MDSDGTFNYSRSLGIFIFINPVSNLIYTAEIIYFISSLHGTTVQAIDLILVNFSDRDPERPSGAPIFFIRDKHKLI